jgi:putative hydrolase of the HAD superfamily
MTKAVFFDAGHTLLYAHPDLGTVYAEATAAFGVRLDPERYAETFVPVFKETTKIYSATSTASDAQDVAMWRDITRRIYDRLPALSGIPFDAWFEALYGRFGSPEVWRFYDDVESALRLLRSRGLKIGVVSNWDTRLKTISDGLGLTPLVDFIVISAEVGVRKPDPGIFRMALDRAGVRPEDALHVGDLLEEDVEGARRAGVRAVLIDRKKRITAGKSPADVRVVTTLAELLPLL